MIDITTTGTGQVNVRLSVPDGDDSSAWDFRITQPITPDEARRISVALAVAVESARKEAPNV